ncbi:hypothetical protein F5Y11DRAFT_179343 [Daldinia sp. FL1419]|nr:hypothetical protein F5Y11DRAFT_179343 [Daldinia sp. FL1419]
MSQNQEKTKCGVCGKSEERDITIQRCGRCKSSFYCSTNCQQKDWPSHKKLCRAKADMTKGKPWYDRYRKCQDGSSHFGELELITWGGGCETTGEELGWGHCSASESAELKRKYEEEFKSDDARMHKYWPQGFRWTCCGLASDMNFGCDHHGTGPKPCSCDFCHSGKPLPDRIYKDTIPRRGLRLSRGPDPRSFDEVEAGVAASARSFLGLPE